MKKHNVAIILLFLCFYPGINSQDLSQPVFSQYGRSALVIGNGNYQLGVLANPENDARAMAEVLTKLGFQVYKYENLTQSQMRMAIDDFGDKLRGNDVGLFYYAGHGIQSNGSNYLIPIDAKLSNERMVEYDCVELGRILAFMEASGAKVNIIVLDACRNNPFDRGWSRSANSKGLAYMNAPQGSVIAYATAPGSTASDGSGTNGLYTAAILENIVIPDITVLKMFQNVRTTVLQKSGQQQTPWESTSLTGDFYFNPVNPQVKQEYYEGPALRMAPTVFAPKISTPENISITSSQVRIKYNISSDGGAPVIAKGVCYSITGEPTIDNEKTLDGIGSGDFTTTISELIPGTTYKARAYAINSVGTAYSSMISFTTENATPLLTTKQFSTVSFSELLCGGSISHDGGFNILSRGVCWSTSASPTPGDNKTADGAGTGEFASSVKDLLPDTTYYLRAYATNKVDTGYGHEIRFRTLKAGQYTDIEGNVYNTINIVNQLWMAENLRTTKFNDDTPIPHITDMTSWLNQVSPSYSWYGHQDNYKQSYGALYNYKAVQSGKLCPAGWHVANDKEWDALTTLMSIDYAAGYLKEQGTANWKKPNMGVFDYLNQFKALPGGYADETGEFREMSTDGYWWSPQGEKATIRYRQMKNNSSKIFTKNYTNEPLGFSVRCIKDQ